MPPVIIDSTTAGVLGGLGIALGLIGIVTALVLRRRLVRLEKHYQALMQDVDGADVASALEAFVGRLGSAERRLDGAEGRIGIIEERLRRTVQHVAVSRYRAFADAGGDQSFTVAMADDLGDGVVMSGLHGRGGIRVYAKPLLKGRSSYALTTEEEEAVAKAMNGGPTG